jgi:hypothetical protein
VPKTASTQRPGKLGVRKAIFTEGDLLLTSFARIAGSQRATINREANLLQKYHGHGISERRIRE